MTREGYIKNVIYSNESNGYAVFEVEGDDGDEIFVGNIFGLAEGIYIIAEGDYVNHPQYDIQFKFTSCEVQMPDDLQGIERYLGSGIIKGIGEVIAKRIVNKFKLDTLRIIEDEPERLAEIRGISERKARDIAVSYADKKEYREVVIFLSQYGISINLAMKIYNEYGNTVYNVIKNNPYKLAEDITGVGFKQADVIARSMGISENSEYRLRAALMYVLSQASVEGHMFLPKEQLVKKAAVLVSSEPFEPGYFIEDDVPEQYRVAQEIVDIMEEQLVELSFDKKIVLKEIDIPPYYRGRIIGDKLPVVYSSLNYHIEVASAKLLVELKIRYDISEESVNREINDIELSEGISLHENQREAVRAAIMSGVAVITGGPGTGKTTTINTIIKYYEKQGMQILLCAPTGRAAKRMTESTGFPAQTIHRMLEISGAVGDDSSNSGFKFGRNSENPLECDAIIIDEMSMVDSYIFNSLLKAVPEGARLIMVGDVNQLPSVGAGNVLKDIISSEEFPVTVLSKIFRQQGESDIIYNAHTINNGGHIDVNIHSKDFFFIQKNDPNSIINEIKGLVATRLPGFLGVSPLDIQVLTPMRKYETGVENMNQKLQEHLNPHISNKPEKDKFDVIFRKGDKVMQIKNDYKMEWKVYEEPNHYVVEEGTGVFNGDMGIITDINDYDEELTVLFDDGRQTIYGFAQLDELEHAFAITIHKSQGSEYPAVIIPLYNYTKKLMNRNLIYTAITRAKKAVIIVGNTSLVNTMIDNVGEQQRHTTFALRLKEMGELYEI